MGCLQHRPHRPLIHSRTVSNPAVFLFLFSEKLLPMLFDVCLYLFIKGLRNAIHVSNFLLRPFDKLIVGDVTLYVVVSLGKKY